MKTRDGLLRGVGQQVRGAREASDLTQENLGKRAGIGGKYVSEIERGTRDLPLSTLQAIVESGLGLKLDIEFRAKNGSKPRIQLPPLPSAVEEVARAIAALKGEERQQVLSLVRGILGLVRS
jgi:transcriptional regulator with XRE-family HTH domain